MSDLYLDAVDVLRKYISIAFADISDFLEFGQREVPQVNQITGEPLIDREGNQVVEFYNYVNFKDSSGIDTSVLSEVKQGRDGISIKLEDRMKALEKLERYFDLFPDNFKRRIEEEKLRLAQEKSNVMGGGDEPEKDDGFIDALKADAEHVEW